MSERGKFIVFEGVGGSGKSTQIELARLHLEKLGRDVITTREPGGIPEAECIREFIFQLKGERVINADQQVALFFAARNFWVKRLVIPQLTEGLDIISDRTYPSTNAYQGYGEGADCTIIQKMSQIVMGEYKPNGIILLDISPDTAISRKKLNSAGDPFDEQEFEYYERVIEGYREMASTGWFNNTSWYVVDGEQPIDAVSEDVKMILKRIINTQNG